MPSRYCEIFREHSRPLEPISTGQQPVLKRLPGIRAVLFDVYGTLLISGSGEVGTAREQAAGGDRDAESPLDEALRAMGIATLGPAGQGVEYLFQRIEQFHAASRRAGIDYPEVDIVELWREMLAELTRRRVIEEAAALAADPRRLAVEYEARANPCWPMPHFSECLTGLRQRGMVLGLISNAQFYTRELFAALTGQTADQWGFQPELQCYSYQHGRAKPGLALFRRTLAALAGRRIAPAEVLYVGNDMLNDVFPARTLGLRTALFAGDARSFRSRSEQPQLAAISPDLVLTDLLQLVEGTII